ALRAGDQSEDGGGTRPNGAEISARPRRRGDRVSALAQLPPFPSHRGTPPSLMGAGRGGGDCANGISHGDNAIADTPPQAPMYTAAAFTPSHSLPHRGGGMLHIFGAAR